TAMKAAARHIDIRIDAPQVNHGRQKQDQQESGETPAWFPTQITGGPEQRHQQKQRKPHHRDQDGLDKRTPACAGLAKSSGKLARLDLSGVCSRQHSQPAREWQTVRRFALTRSAFAAERECVEILHKISSVQLPCPVASKNSSPITN